MFHTIENILISYANKIPLWLFSPISSIVEEIIAPIPSPVIMIVTGSLAKVQEKGFIFLILLTVLAALGKTVGALFVYFIADKIEDLFSGIIEKYFGVTHAEIESFGKKFTGSYRDYFVMFFLRALPVVPSSLVSIGGGILKLPLKIFIVATFLGSIVRDFIYVYFGYAGISILGDLIKQSEKTESVIQILFFVSVLILLSYLFIKRFKSKKMKL